jgi:hypothetical protein
MEENYIKQLEDTISKFIAPIKDIPFPVAIKVISGHKVIPFNKSSEEDRKLLDKLEMAAQIAGTQANKLGFERNRPNEVGNDIEPYVKKALSQVGLRAETPRNIQGRRQGLAYPDIEIAEPNGRITYLECKTYNIKNISTSQRAFYFSPSVKITHDARHLLLSYQIERIQRGAKMIFVPVHWRIYTIDDLLVSVKHEFNASNRDMYRNEALLAESSIKSK